ncbi:protein containing DUF81 [Pseudovibrio sp. FO-BEG1]|uniref:Probable membrane transporter protein n=1 Tax=Pseudovibrio denitrificans TaxID=258256 RepID=A0A1I6Y9P9_9HYPH|nr:MULTISPECIES: sulfite exporter TauE/SafE family protein [Pseudovibrio]AEV37059.1 protein containing DUF81 [Pseudovibrio sp. FO-BEG1]EEA92778.1 membrane protein [Pseudovibrio sp. JE062]SFT47001.1 Uncharacterized membrane protein YfcA [Pseudovibrio denitrificans]
MDMISASMLGFGAALIASGALAGFLAGLFGIGGGAILVPILVTILTEVGVDPDAVVHISVASSLGVIVPTSLRSFFAHKKKGAVDLSLLKSWIIPVPIGVLLASYVAALVSGDTLKGIFAVIAFVVAMRMLFNRESWKLGSDIPGNPVRALIGVMIGFFSTLMGIGGGVMNNTFMTLFGRPIHQAVATSSGVGVLISIPAVFGMVAAGWGAPNLPPFSVGYINLLAIALIIPITIYVAPLGAHFAHNLPKRKLELAFGVFLLIACARFAYSLL